MVGNITYGNAQTLIDENSVVVIKFFATWCGPCKRFAPVFEAVAGRVRGAKFFQADIDKERALAQYFKVKSVPTLVILKDQQIATTFSGGLLEKDLEALVREHLGS